MTATPDREINSAKSSGTSQKIQSKYGSVVTDSRNDGLEGPHIATAGHCTLLSFASLKDEASKIAFLENTRSHHHPHTKLKATTGGLDSVSSPLNSPLSPAHIHFDAHTHELESPIQEENVNEVFFTHSNLRKIALDLSLWVNIFILLIKAVAYLETLSLSILAALVDSILDVVSQWILAYTERRSSKTRSSAHYPAGAARLEPLGVLSCAALMGFASFGVLKESLATLYEGFFNKQGNLDNNFAESFIQDENWSSFWSMFGVVFVKLALYALCIKVGHVRAVENDCDDKYYVDSTLEAVAQDHWNDCLSNAVAAVALILALSNQRLWCLDPFGAIIISLYIIYSWYETGKEQIEQLTGKAAPSDFIDELYEVANNFDSKVSPYTLNCHHEDI